ncbi:VWA domain-containing protein [Sphingomonas sp. CFBP8993]|uniref:VWA domain-containing protein n=1 Tax=Sphingomonas sp. CFBP8993 TaxID=3096526 RepID=UPI002A6AEC51|nr:VWA domain-containing protein [Sphingomonas sp. CFBP8993]MDY0957235.1 VWA domain-containing protein [Sphingomonas sp. CFBP8993]
MSITFLFPVAAWLFLLVPPLLWWPMRARPRWGHAAVRAAVYACLIIAMMQPSLVRRDGAGAQIYILDQRSVLGAAGQAAARRALDRVMATAPADARTSVIQLGGSASGRIVLHDGSLSQALRNAAGSIPLGSRGAVTLIGSDLSTDDHWRDSIAALVARGIPVNTISVPTALRPAFVADVRMAAARAGETLRADVVVQGDGGTHRLAVFSGDQRLATSTSFRADGETHVALDIPTQRAGFLPLRVELDGGGNFQTLAAIQEPRRLLYLGERQRGAAGQLQQLLGPSFVVDQRAPSALSEGIDPARWPLVMVDDLPASRLPVAAQQSLNRAVARGGTGLFVSGGMAAFGAGGYADTALGAALPVTARAQDKQVRPSVALAIVIDSSGSMQGDRLELAKQVARQTVRKLNANDWVGVVEFYGARQWSVPMHHATDVPDIERAIGRMQAQGASVLFPALQEAFYGLKDLDARYKHILVISDGGVAEDRYQQLLRHIAENRINISTVAVGGQVDDEKSMADWARVGRGRFYSVPDEFNLVELDFKQPQTRPDPGYRSGSVAVRGEPRPGWWDGAKLSAPPPLSGYVQTRTRPETETLLRTDGGDPILSSWPVGSGRVTAMMTEPLGAGTASWRGWPDYGRWLARVLAMTARARPELTVDTARRFDRLTITVRRNGSGTVDATMPTITLVDADGRPQRRIDGVEERAPGLFMADIAWPGKDSARIEVRDGGHLALAADSAFSDVRPVQAMPDFMALPFDTLSSRTGGWHRDDPAAQPGSVQRIGGLRAIDLWPWMTLLALGLYLFDIGYRRWPSRRIAGIR